MSSDAPTPNATVFYTPTEAESALLAQVGLVATLKNKEFTSEEIDELTSRLGSASAASVRKRISNAKASAKTYEDGVASGTITPAAPVTPKKKRGPSKKSGKGEIAGSGEDGANGSNGNASKVKKTPTPRKRKPSAKALKALEEAPSTEKTINEEEEGEVEV